jgi:DNA-binding CsgD family transcriptional regulator
MILSGLDEESFSKFSLITATHLHDLVYAIQSSQPLLIILNYDRNQEVVDAVFRATSTQPCPIYCLTNNRIPERLSWKQSQILFTFPFEIAMSENSLGSRINSLLMLISQQRASNYPSTLIPERSKLNSNSELSRYALELDKKVQLLDRVHSEIKELSQIASDEVQTKVRALLGLIKQAKSDHRYWTEFKDYFSQINPNFFQELSKKHPTLTAKDLKYCCYLRMNLSSNEIMRLLGINQESVRTHKYRLKKKMALSKDQNLEHYLIRVQDKSENALI